MAKIRVSQDIIPVSDFKAQASEWLRRIARRGNTLVITQNGKPAGVLLSPATFDELSVHQHVVAAIQEGMADEQAGHTYTNEEVFNAVEKRIDTIETE